MLVKCLHSVSNKLITASLDIVNSLLILISIFCKKNWLKVCTCMVAEEDQDCFFLVLVLVLVLVFKFKFSKKIPYCTLGFWVIC